MQVKNSIVSFLYDNPVAVAALWLCAVAAGMLLGNAGTSLQDGSDMNTASGTAVRLAWSLAGSLLLFAALRTMRLGPRPFVLIAVLTIFGLVCGAADAIQGVAAASAILFCFAAVESRHDLWNGVPLILGLLVTPCCMVGASSVLFSKRRLHLLAGWIISGGGLLLLRQFGSLPWDVSQGFGLPEILGSLTGWDGIARWTLVAGILFLLAPAFRIRQYENRRFRLHFLASALMVPALWNGMQNGGAIVAIVAAGLWYANIPTCRRRPLFDTTLLLLLLLTAPGAGGLLPGGLREMGLEGAPGTLAALLIWLKTGTELLCIDFAPSAPTNPLQRAERLDVVLPCYNPSEGWVERLVDTHHRFSSRLEGCNVRFIVVNDGSSRGFTAEAQQRLTAALPGTVIVDNAMNRGKGAAVRDGVARCTSEIALYTDYDFPYDVDAMCHMVGLLEKGYDVVIATRNLTYYSRLSTRRKIMSFASRILNFVVLGLTHTDTQGGLKGFSRRGKSFLASTRTPRFLFDTEFIYHASQHPGVTICEMPADLREGVHLPDMRGGVLAEELKNLLLIALRG